MDTMMKFQKRPVVVEATQWFEDGDHPAVRTVAKDWGLIDTPDGQMTVYKGDWVITNAAGRIYPCRPDIFTKAYIPIRDERKARAHEDS